MARTKPTRLARILAKRDAALLAAGGAVADLTCVEEELDTLILRIDGQLDDLEAERLDTTHQRAGVVRTLDKLRAAVGCL